MIEAVLPTYLSSTSLPRHLHCSTFSTVSPQVPTLSIVRNSPLPSVPDWASTLSRARLTITNMDDNSDILEVSPVGDIILVVGPPGEEQLRLRVSSTILRSASKVFDAMFSPPWVESSRTLSIESPKNIDLPEDDPEAMKAICYAIHHRPDMIPFVDVNAKQILQAARTIDKYDLGTAMQLVTDKWLRQQLQAKSVEDLLYLAAAAMVLKNYKAFSKLTWLVMITHEGSYLRFQNDDQLRELFPSEMFCKGCPTGG